MMANNTPDPQPGSSSTGALEDDNSKSPPITPMVGTGAPSMPQESALQSHLQPSLAITDVEILEKCVENAVGLLGSLKEPLQACSTSGDCDATNWVRAVDELLSRPSQKPTIVGVVGNTGAGKSSVINAVLDEERLLPTSGMRACTSSVTEVSYNYSDDPDQLYRAEIEFITAGDWLKELEILYGDLLNSDGKVVKECTGDTDAGRAYAKIKAVYPKMTKEQIEKSRPADLGSDYAVLRVVGTVQEFQSTSAHTMYKRLQNYVDSNEKTAAADQRMEYWPLIKVVRIYTKASALASGAVIVDLPGVQDSNAARAAVAANYQKQCTGLWIVAPITRAVDDKTAKKLLGDSFRRQLKYDGIYSAVTFICSKTDDISVTEVSDGLRLETKFAETWEEIESLNDKMREHIGLMQELKDQKAALAESYDQVENEWEEWDELGEKLSGGLAVYVPSPDRGKKRKRTGKPSGSRKDRLSIDTDSDIADDSMSDSDSLSSYDKKNDNDDRVPLTEDQVEERLSQIKAQRKTIRENRKENNSEILGLRLEMRELTLKKDKLESHIRSVCIKGRNTYSRQAIKQDFAMGIKELDQEAAMKMDEANFDPEEDLRDYDQVAESLPVFCVSSRAYQQLRGRMRKDNFNHNGYTCPEDTEIPQLQQHAKKLTEAGRTMSSRIFLNDFASLLTSMRMWAANDGTSHYTETARGIQQARLQGQLSRLMMYLQAAIDVCVAKTKRALEKNVFDTLEKTIPVARHKASLTAHDWGVQPWSTYKATARRTGTWHRDFNVELWQPMEVNLASGWERAFQRLLPSILQEFLAKLGYLFDIFHSNAVAHAREHSVNLAGVLMLDQQLQGHKQRVKDIPTTIMTIIQEIQRNVNRSFTPIIREDMRPVYTTCVNESGPGSYKRMKDHMCAFVDAAKDTMFKHASDHVVDQLNNLCDRITQELCIFIHQGVYPQMSRDYQAVLVGTDNHNFSSLTRSQRTARGHILLALEEANKAFDESITELAINAGEGEGSKVDWSSDETTSEAEVHLKPELASPLHEDSPMGATAPQDLSSEDEDL